VIEITRAALRRPIRAFRKRRPRFSATITWVAFSADLLSIAGGSAGIAGGADSW
jgi:hypothetical protein